MNIVMISKMTVQEIDSIQHSLDKEQLQAAVARLIELAN